MCFFNEDETHLGNPFSSIGSPLGGPVVQTPASGKGDRGYE